VLGARGGGVTGEETGMGFGEAVRRVIKQSAEESRKQACAPKFAGFLADGGTFPTFIAMAETLTMMIPTLQQPVRAKAKLDRLI
jgi:hypothetical protein